MARTTKAPPRKGLPRPVKAPPRYVPAQPRAAPEGGIARTTLARSKPKPRRLPAR